ncbi:cellulose synthase operon protein YhjQ/BcsQ [Deinococcus terrestris]|uniref:cellulose synthase operon protein YhjQ/BcsQ n=1 Tax=Deinococcus terrestris TaxID=2651870 RepID=UPI00128E2A71|nr:cellulose synthase operon protein YhjQ/BcsQ [Deinococcus terrestris]
MTIGRTSAPGSSEASRQEAETEIDLATLLQGVRRRLPAVLLTAAVLALAAYLWSLIRPPVYEATANLLASSSQSQIGVVGGAVVSPLPPGTVADVVASPLILRPLVQAVEKSPEIGAEERQRLVRTLTRDLLTGGEEGSVAPQHRTISVTAEQGGQENSTYQVRARAQTPQAAQVLANLTVSLLLEWDTERTLRDVRLARENFTLQLAQTDRRLALPGLSALERQTLLYRRATMQDNLAQLRLLEQAQPGVLKPLSAATEPLRPVSSSPLRNAGLTALLALLLGTGLATLLAVLDRRIQSEAGLLSLGLPVLGVLPRLSGRGAAQLEQTDALGFVRINLQATLPVPRPILMISGITGGEGASALTSALASSLAASGQRVLILDADARHGRPREWDAAKHAGSGPPLSGASGVRRLEEAPGAPTSVQVRPAAPGVDVLPIGMVSGGSLGLSHPELGEWLRRWSQGYDVVLVDSPPLSTFPDGLALGRHADATLLVIAAGQTLLPDVQQVLRRLQVAGAPVLGFVLNQGAAPSRPFRRGSGPSVAAPRPAPSPAVKEVR